MTGDYAVSVNLSARQLASPDLVAAVAGALASSAVPAGLRLPRDHRDDAALASRLESRHAPVAPGSRRPPHGRRLRHRLLVAQLPAPAADRLAQDRPLVHRRARRRLARHRHRGGRHRAGQSARARRRRRGRGDAGPAGAAAGDGMPDGPGFLVLRALGGRRHGTVPHRRVGCVRRLGDGEVTSSTSSQPPAANSSTSRWASSSWYCTGGDFMK